MRRQRRQSTSDRGRPSWPSRIARVSAWGMLRPFTTLVPLNTPGVWVARRVVAGSLALLSRPLPETTLAGIDELGPGGLRVRGEWVCAPKRAGGVGDGAVVLWVHGSGYAICSARTHRGLTSRVSAETGMTVFACDYRLAPRHRFPAAAHDVRAAYDWLLGQGYAPEGIVLAGDSAGGHLAVDLVCELARAGRSVPGALVLFSPLLDLTFELAHSREQCRRDPLISAARAAKLLARYTGDADPADPRLALSVPPGCPWPPTLIQAGGAEMLVADAEHLAEMIRTAGGSCELQVWPGQLHVFQALAALVPEGRVALARAGQFLGRVLPASAQDPSVAHTPAVEEAL